MRARRPPAAAKNEEKHKRCDRRNLDRAKDRTRKDRRLGSREDRCEPQRAEDVSGKGHSKLEEVDQASDGADDPERGRHQRPSALPPEHAIFPSAAGGGGGGGGRRPQG